MIFRMSSRVQRSRPFEGRLFSVEVLDLTDEGGRSYRREVVRHPGAVVIVPVLSGDRLAMIRNYRIAPDQRLWELPAGKLEPGEDPQHTAGRELEEETGYRARNLRKLGEFYTSPGFADELIRVYAADAADEVGQRLEPGEDIELEILPRQQVLAMVDSGEIRDAKTIAALFLWERQRRAS
jgi:ADP-ribose pyrophosphatase